MKTNFNETAVQYLEQATAQLGWATAKDDDKEETEQEPETPGNGEGGDNQGGGVDIEG